MKPTRPNTSFELSLLAVISDTIDKIEARRASAARSAADHPDEFERLKSVVRRDAYQLARDELTGAFRAAFPAEKAGS